MNPGRVQGAAFEDADSPDVNTVHMKIATVDPRDQTWEIDDPKYRVYFHDAAGSSDEYEIGGADVSDVWHGRRHDARDELRSCVLTCLTTGLGLLRLQGSDPNAR